MLDLYQFVLFLRSGRIYQYYLLRDHRIERRVQLDIEAWRKKDCFAYDNSTEFIKPQQVIETLYKVTNGDAIITSDVGQHQMFAANYYKFKKPRQWINSGGAGTMGYGLPAAIGCKVAFPERPVCCVTGDGSILHV
jgi:acetolactate synthase-1/2/3 large subunit